MGNQLVIIQLLLLTQVWTCITAQCNSSAFGDCEGELDSGPEILKPCLEEYQVYLNKETQFEDSKMMLSLMDVDIYCCAQYLLDKCIEKTLNEYDFNPCNSNAKTFLIRNQLIISGNFTGKMFIQRSKNNESCPCDVSEIYCPKLYVSEEDPFFGVMFILSCSAVIVFGIGELSIWCWQQWHICCCKKNNGNGPVENGSEQRTNSLESGL